MPRRWTSFAGSPATLDRSLPLPRLRLAGIVVNAVDNTKEHRFREREIAATFGDLVWTPAIPRRAVIAAAYGANTPLRRYGTPEARHVAAVYDDLAARLLREAS